MPSWILPAFALVVLLASISVPASLLIFFRTSTDKAARNGHLNLGPDDLTPRDDDHGMTGRVSPADFERTER